MICELHFNSVIFLRYCCQKNTVITWFGKRKTHNLCVAVLRHNMKNKEIT